MSKELICEFEVPRHTKVRVVAVVDLRLKDEMTWEKTYRSELCSELNVERFGLLKDGAIALSHSSGRHDDVFWVIALAVYGTVEMKEFDSEALWFV